MNTLVNLVPGVNASLLGAAHCSVAYDNVASLRTGLTTIFSATMSPNTLKQADEQTLTALTAVGQVLADIPQPHSWSDWSVIACPRRPGRKRLTDSLSKFRIQGAWSVSPHIIPQTLLHSLSGLISQAVGAHGPNMGIGGVAGSEQGVLQTAAAWLAGGDAVGLWLVWTKWDRETFATDAVCEARVALLTRADFVADTEPFWTAFDRVTATELHS